MYEYLTHLIYREHMTDYVINERGEEFYEPKTSIIFKHFEDAVGYLIRNYGERKRDLVIDNLNSEKISELERKLKRTKVNLKKSN